MTYSNADSYLGESADFRAAKNLGSTGKANASTVAGEAFSIETLLGRPVVRLQAAAPWCVLRALMVSLSRGSMLLRRRDPGSVDRRINRSGDGDDDPMTIEPIESNLL
jgi:hypothetical protein